MYPGTASVLRKSGGRHLAELLCGCMAAPATIQQAAQGCEGSPKQGSSSQLMRPPRLLCNNCLRCWSAVVAAAAEYSRLANSQRRSGGRCLVELLSGCIAA
eukprot:1608721-Alexandrium_andersonii.AAC.1